MFLLFFSVFKSCLLNFVAPRIMEHSYVRQLKEDRDSVQTGDERMKLL